MKTPPNNIQARIIRYIDNSNIKEITNFIRTEATEELINLKLGENSMSILHKIVLSNNFLLLNEVLRTLENKMPMKMLKAFLNKQDDEGNIALHYSAFKGNLDIIIALLSFGSNYHIKSSKGLTMIHMAAQGDQISALIYFKEQLGMNIASTDNSGSTPLHWAVYASAENSINFLLAFGLNVNAQDNRGRTPLHLSAFTENAVIIKKLLSKGGNVHIKSKDNKTPLDIALEKGSPQQIIALFKDKKASSQGSCFNSSASFLFILFSLMLIVYYVLVPYIDRYYSGLLFGFFNATLIAYGYINYSNPGFTSIRYNGPWLGLVQKRIKIESLCPYCKAQVNSLSKHCSQCNHCVYEHYHHCNWTGTCIGEGNSTLYLFFLVVLLGNIGMLYYVSLAAFLVKSSVSPVHKTILFTVPYCPLLRTIMAIVIMSICIALFVITGFCFFKQMRKQLIHRKIKEK